jgi:micrococcal nuclease
MNQGLPAREKAPFAHPRKMTTLRHHHRPPRLARLAWLTLALLLLAADSSSITARVIKVRDGDSLRVVHGSRAFEVRLWGIDAPEHDQPYGDKARQLTDRLAYRQTVTLIVHDHDPYGRTVVEVILPDGRNLNEELLRAGLAWWYQNYAPDQKEFQALEAQARVQHLGLWSDLHPIPPWEWRHEHEP